MAWTCTPRLWDNNNVSTHARTHASTIHPPHEHTGSVELGGILHATEHDDVGHVGRVGPKVARVGAGGDKQRVVGQGLAIVEQNLALGRDEFGHSLAQHHVDRGLQ